jgi:regulatory protein
MNITAITAQVKTAGRYSIFVDGKYAFSLGENGLLESKLAIGQELDETRLKELKQQSADDKVYGLALRYAAMRPRSEWEVRSYLQRKKASPALADKILNKLRKFEFINDENFAKTWIENRRRLKPSSQRKLQQELLAKHIDEETIHRVLAEEGAEEQAALKSLIAKKRARYPDTQKLMQYLARQGFRYDDIKSALEENDY